MAVVFRAFDERLDRLVALKVLAPALATDEAFRHRFIRESRSAAAVDDPHVIPVFEAGEADGLLFIAMRYVRGGDVGTLVRREGPLPAARTGAIISAVASALDAAHAVGLIHRDVKPANMLIDVRAGRPDHVYLSDFGLTKGASSATGLTSMGYFLGTLDYCAPEQIQGVAADARTDEYALACATFVLLSGEPPFPRDEGTAVMYAQLSEAPPRLSERRPSLPVAVNDVLLRALAKAPGDRYPSCGEFADALRLALGLESYHADQGVGALPDHPATEVARIRDPDQPPAVIEPATVSLRQAPISAPDSVPATGTADRAPSGGRGHRHAGVIAIAAAAVLATGGIIAAVIVAGAMGHSAALTASSSHGTSATSGTTGQHSGAARQAGQGVLPTKTASSRSASSGTGGGVNQGTAAPTIVHALSDSGNGTRHVDSVAFSPDGTTLATGDANGTTCLWSAGTGRLMTVLHGGANAKVLAVAFSADGAMVAAGYGDGSTSLWNAATSQLIGTIQDPAGKAVNSVAFSPSGATLATGDGNGSAYLWNVSNGGQSITLARTLADPAGVGIWALAFSPDGQTLATGDYHGGLYLWDAAAASGSPTDSFTVSGNQDVTAVAFSADGRTVAIGDIGGTAYLWNRADGTHTAMPEPATIWAVAFNRSGTLAIGDADGSTYLQNAASGGAKGVLTDPATGSEGVGAVAFSPNGQLLATGDTNGITYVWRVS